MTSDPFEGAEPVARQLNEQIIEAYAREHGISIKAARDMYLLTPFEMYLNLKEDNDD